MKKWFKVFVPVWGYVETKFFGKTTTMAICFRPRVGVC